MATGMPPGDPKDVVRRSYDRIPRAYRGDSVSRERGYFAWLEALVPLLQHGDAILDLGCGCGIPVAQDLAQRFQVTDVDISAVQIARARQLVPQATFLCADMSTLQFSPSTFAAVVSLFAIIHLPPRSRRLSRGLRPRAPLLARLSPILSGRSRRRSTALCLAPGRVDGAAALGAWAEPRRGGAAGGGRAQKCRLNFLSASHSIFGRVVDEALYAYSPKNSLSLLYRYGTMRSTHRKSWRGLSASATRGIHVLR